MGITRDLLAAHRLSFRSCELGSGERCYNLAFMRMRGEVGERDERVEASLAPDRARGRPLLGRACELGEAMAARTCARCPKAPATCKQVPVTPKSPAC